jgi:hypothetical protein
MEPAAAGYGGLEPRDQGLELALAADEGAS